MDVKLHRPCGRRGGCQCKRKALGHTRFIHFWQRMEARGLFITITYFHGDDKTESEVGLEVPAWIWRPYCWVKGHSDSTYGDCVICRAPMSRRKV